MAKYAAYGTILKIYYSAAWHTIPAVQDIKGPGMSLDPIDVTSHDSTSGFKEFLAGLADAGEFSFTIVYDPAGAEHGQIRSALTSRTLTNFGMQFVSGAKWQFSNCVVTSFSPSQPVAGAVTVDVSVKCNGIPNFSATL